MEGLKVQTESIDGVEVTTTQFLPMRAHKLLARLAKVLGPAIGEIANVEIGSDGSMTDLKLGSLGPALVRVFAELDDITAEKLPLEILASTTAITTDANGNKQKHDLGTLAGYNAAFLGMGLTPYLVLAFALKVNYARFLDDLAALVPQAPAKVNPSSGVAS